MPKYAPPPDLTESEIDALMMSPLSADEIEELSAPEPEIETISLTDLLLLGIEPRLARIADALETANKIKAANRNDITGLTAGVNRLADAFEAMAGFIGCVTETVEGTDGVGRCYVRTRDDNHGFLLSYRDDRD